MSKEYKLELVTMSLLSKKLLFNITINNSEIKALIIKHGFYKNITNKPTNAIIIELFNINYYSHIPINDDEKNYIINFREYIPIIENCVGNIVTIIIYKK